jgi:hypothetical protein
LNQCFPILIFVVQTIKQVNNSDNFLNTKIFQNLPTLQVDKTVLLNITKEDSQHYLHFLGTSSVALVIVTIHILTSLEIGLSGQLCAMVFLTLIVAITASGTVTSIHEMSEVFVSAEAVLMHRSRVNSLQHVLLDINSGNTEIRRTEVAMI